MERLYILRSKSITMGLGAKIIFAIIIIHFVVGFGYLMYKLSPRKKDKDSSKEE
ncbi:MAG: hypothetical protein ABFS32_15030 [Bacteroidota bacterium]